MRRINSNIINAIQYFKNKQAEESITSIASKYCIQRHTLSKNLKKDLINKAVFLNNEWWELSENEVSALEYYRNHDDKSYKLIEEKFGIEKRRFEKILKIHKIELPVFKYTHEFNRDAFESIKTEQDAYWLGFILADGYLNEDRGFLNIKLATKDLNHLWKFCDYLESDYSVIKEDVGGVGNKVYSLFINSRNIINNLKKYGLHQRKSCVEIPYYNISIDLRKHYIRGIIDGDGWIRKNLNGFGCVGSLETLEFIRSYLCEIVDLNHSYIKKHEKIMKFEIRDSKLIKQIITHFYKDSQIYLDRKMNLAMQIF